MRSLFAWLAMWLLISAAPAAEVSVAVAANFAGVVQKLAPIFEQETGHRLVVSAGSTGRFYAQIRNGAPFQVLLSADDETPAKLEKEGLAVSGTRETYAIGRLVLWSPAAGRVDHQGEVLRSAVEGRLAIADPKVAPYGQAAIQTLSRMGLIDRWQSRFVQGESIGQTHQFVASGNAPLGFVALSQVMVDGKVPTGSYWLVPDTLHDSLRQDMVLLNPGRGNAAAMAFQQFLRSDRARQVIRSFGYELPRK